MSLLAPASDFTYASPEDARWRRTVIHVIEQITGKPRLWQLYADYCRGAAAENFFSEAVCQLALDVAVDDRDLARIPREGPLVVVANHPFGVIDGIVLGYLISLVRRDFRILANSVLYRLPVQIVEPIDYADLSGFEDRRQLSDYLRALTYAPQRQP